MTHLNRFLILLLATSLLIGCAKIKVVRIPEQGAPPPATGVIYALPNTVVRVLVKVNKFERTGARYAMFAAIFAPGKKPVCKDEDCTEENKKKFSIEDGASFDTYGEPDPANVFLVQFTGGGTIDQKLSMTWNEAGLLSAASAEVTNRTMDVALSGLKLVAGLGTKAFLGAAAAKAGEPCTRHSSENDVWIRQILQDNAGALAPPLLANYCRIKKEDRDKFVENGSNRALLIEATKEYVNHFGLFLRTRDDILNGNYKNQEPVSLLNRIEAEIDRELTTLYIGVQDKESWDGVLDVRTITEGAPVAVLRIDPEKGICRGNSELRPDAKPIPTEFLLSSDACAKARTVDLTLDYYPERGKQLFTKMTDVTTGDRSFRYRIPAQVKARLHDTQKTYGSGFFSVAQLGTIISLPATRQSKNLSYELAFIEATGALKTFKLGTAGGLDAGTIDALGGVGGTLLDARSAARKSADELTVLTREYTLLKLRDDICTIQKKYGLPCTVEP